MFLHLDLHFNPAPNQPAITFESFTFSGGEPHLKIQTDLSEESTVTITQRINTFQDFGLVLLAIDALRRLGIQNINLLVPYFPGARQDRVMIPGEPLTVKVYADILNYQGLQEIGIYDPHSEVAPALLNNCKVYNNHFFIQRVAAELPKDLLLVSPDGGALKKIYKVAAALQDYEVIECSKSRDVKTGKLSGFKVGAQDLQGRPCLIVDDICDGGGTFLGLAKELKAKNAGPLFLAVSHGIFSKGLDHLQKYFTKIYTTDSIRNIDHHLVQQLPLKDLLNH